MRFREDDLGDLHGKVVLLTGGNTGIGYGTIQILARRGAKVYMGARNAARAAEAIERLKAEKIGDGSVHWLELDLTDPRLASKAAKEFMTKEQRLDILINNAAFQGGPYSFDADGLLDGMVIGHISHFVLTETLLPLMKRTAAEPGSDVRIVNVTSYAHTEVAPETLATKEAVNKSFGDSTTGRYHNYGLTKLANILHIKALQTRLDTEGVRMTCLAPHPGVIKTKGVQYAMGRVPYMGWFLTGVIMRLFFTSWHNGGMVVAFAAAGKEVVGPQHEKYKGAYLTPDGLSTPSKSATDPRLQEELYETTERIMRDLGL